MQTQFFANTNLQTQIQHGELERYSTHVHAHVHVHVLQRNDVTVGDCVGVIMHTTADFGMHAMGRVNALWAIRAPSAARYGTLSSKKPGPPQNPPY